MLYNALPLILFMPYARKFFENLVIVKSGVNNLNAFEKAMLLLSQCRNTHLQLFVMSTIYEILVKPTFMAVKDTEEINNIQDVIKLTTMVDQIIYCGKQNTNNFIDGLISSIYQHDMTREQKIFLILSSKIIEDYLRDDAVRKDNEGDYNNLCQVLNIMVSKLPKHEQAKWRVLHKEKDEWSRDVLNTMMKTVLDEIKSLHIRRTKNMRKGGEILTLSAKEIDDLSHVPVHNDRIEETFGKYSQYGAVARNSNNTTRQTIAMMKVNKLNNYLDDLKEQGRLDDVMNNVVKTAPKYQQKIQQKDDKIEKDRAAHLAQTIQHAKMKTTMKYQKAKECFEKTKDRITKKDVEDQIATLKTKASRVKYYKSILNNYKQVQELKNEIEEELNIKLTWSEHGKNKSEDILKQYVYTIIDYFQPGQ